MRLPRAVTFLLALAGTFLLPLAAAGQLPDSLSTPPPVAQEAGEEEAVGELEPQGVTPRGAFIRSALVPGWGHAEVGAHGRGGFYVAVETAAAFMLFKTHTGLTQARNRLELTESVITARLETEGITDPTNVEAALAEDPDVEDLRALEESRAGQKEDWIALGIFFLFLGGADAYVSAHLAEVPAALDIEGNQTGGMDVAISIPVRFF